ncbi:MAG: glycosyltransferase family 2 protein [Pseudomonadota bacterium]
MDQSATAPAPANVTGSDVDESLTIAVLVPCYNEAQAIEKVVADFASALPNATIYVYDNNSTDGTREIAAEAGAVVRTESLQGKGNVVRRMFADVEADVYVMVDGDDTYNAPDAPSMVAYLRDNHLDMVNGRRVTEISEAYRFGHRFGNRVLTDLVSYIFGKRFDDMLSGYRIFSRRFVKSFPVMTRGFEIETELTVHALELQLPVGEVPTAYKDRPEGSVSKLSTYKDGFRILKMIAFLAKEERPLQFFSILAGVLSIVSLSLATPIVIEFMDTGLVPRFPTAILSTGIMLSALLSFFTGLVLDTVTHGRVEQKRLRYLAVSNSVES